jgi:hypothetical protein
VRGGEDIDDNGGDDDPWASLIGGVHSAQIVRLTMGVVWQVRRLSAALAESGDFAARVTLLGR